MTLLEVAAATVILSTLLIGVVLARARFVHQWTRADRQLRASAAADALLTKWWKDPGHFPLAAKGAVPAEPQMIWQTMPVTSAEAQSLGVRVVRLEIHWRPTTDPSSLLVAVEVLVRDEHAIQTN
jgi:hypothetical protein